MSEQAAKEPANVCPKCGAAFESKTLAWKRYECSSVDWKGTPRFDRDNNVIGRRGFAQSSLCKIREQDKTIVDQAARIEELESENNVVYGEYQSAGKQIAELEVKLLINRPGAVEIECPQPHIAGDS